MATIKLGNHDNLSVFDDYSIGDTIILGNGINDFVSAIGSQNDIITLGNGAGDAVNANGFYLTPSNNDVVSMTR
jgi:hypothetical protein